MRQVIFTVLFILASISVNAQFLFEGQVNAADWNGQAYLSEITDYRKLDGVFKEQLVQRTAIDEFGVFKFEGDDLPQENRLYRIHVDNCESYEEGVDQFSGHCEESKAIIFIANNKDTISLPQGFDQEIFCQAISTNEATNAILKVDSILDVMKYDFVGLNSKIAESKVLDKWFNILQGFSQKQDPLVALYAYARLTDRSTILYDHYKRTLAETDYYDLLGSRLEKQYEATALNQLYQQELSADKFSLNNTTAGSEDNTFLYAGLISSLLLIIVIYWYGRKRPGKVKHGNLTAQEQKVLDLIKQNHTNKEIASELFISHSTVKSHVNNIYRKLGVTSREEIKKLNIK